MHVVGRGLVRSSPSYNWVYRAIKGLVILLGLFLWSCATHSTSGNGEPIQDLAIGVIDPQRILQETDKGKRLTDTLNAFMKDRQAIIELEQKELRSMESKLRAQVSVLSPSARQQKELQFREKMGAYQQKVAELNREVQEKQRDLQNEFRRDVKEVVAEIAQSKNLSVVLEHGANSGTLYYQKQLDISDEVIQALNGVSP